MRARSTMTKTSGSGSDASSTSREKIGTFASLGIRNFRFLLAGSVLSNAAMWIQQVTLSYLVYDLTGSGTMLGTINLVRAVASVGMIPIAGVLIDRLNRRKLILIENGWLFTITFTLGLMLLSGHRNISYLFIFSFLGGIVQTVDMTLRQVLVFDLVPRRSTPNAVAIIQTGWSLMRVSAPALGGLVYPLVGPGGNFLIQASAYVLIAITIIQIQFPARKLGAVLSSPLQNIREGIRYIMKERTTRTFMLMGTIMPLLTIPIFSILPPIYAKEVFHGGSDVFGFLLASVGVGGIVGGVVTASLGRLERRGLLQLASLLLLSLSLIGFAFSTKLWVALLLLASAGFFEMIFLTTNQTLLQLSLPDNIRGQVTSIVSLNIALSPLGGQIAGTGSDLLGGPKMITIIMAGIAAVIAVFVLIFSSTVRNYRLSQAMAQESVPMPIDTNT